MYRTRDYHRYKTQCVIRKRLRLLKQIDPNYYKSVKDKPNRFSKRHPFDCGRTKCCVCHFEKAIKIEKAKYRYLYM